MFCLAWSPGYFYFTVTFDNSLGVILCNRFYVVTFHIISSG